VRWEDGGAGQDPRDGTIASKPAAKPVAGILLTTASCCSASLYLIVCRIPLPFSTPFAGNFQFLNILA